MAGREIGSSSGYARSRRSSSPDSPPGLGISGIQSRSRSACAIPTMASGSSVSGSLEMVPVSVYEAMCKECDNVHDYNNQLRSMMHTYMERMREQPQDPVIVTRLQTLIQIVRNQMDEMPPPTNVKFGKARMVCQMVTDELQSIVDQLQM